MNLVTLVDQISERLDVYDFVHRVSDACGMTGVCIADYGSDFSWLWSLEAGNKASKSFDNWLEERADEDSTIVIAWEQMPPLQGRQDTHLINHLTPIDWALSMSAELLIRQPQEHPKLRIILVVGSQVWSYFPGQGVFALDMRNSIEREMPWLRTMTLDECCNTLVASENDRFGDFECLGVVGEDCRNQVLNLNGAWQVILSGTGEKHSINNVVAPLLLLGDPIQSTAMVGALARRMKSLSRADYGTSREDVLTSQAPWLDWGDEFWRTKLERLGRPKSNLKLLVLDDQWKEGWGEVICKAVGVFYSPDLEKITNGFACVSRNKQNDRITVKASDSADWLFEKIESLKHGTDARFFLSLDEDGEESSEVLFLDLRLYSRRPIEDEVIFIRQLVACARELQNVVPRNLPWPGFDEEELGRIDEWLEASHIRPREDPAYHEALTLLPRIISQLDPSYPIILFSSTGRREIIERFNGYANIIKRFGKPRLTGAVLSDIASQSRTDFRSALRESLAVLLARSRCQKFWGASNPYGEVSSLRDDDGRAFHIELYIDESDPQQENDQEPSYRKGWRVGGCYAVFEGATESEAQEKADRFDDDLVRNGVRYFKWRHTGVQPEPDCETAKDSGFFQRRGYERKHSPCWRALRKALEESSNAPIKVGVASLYQSIPDRANQTDDLLDCRHDDQLFLTTLGAFVEVFLYETIPSLLDDKSYSVALYAGTRINVFSRKVPVFSNAENCYHGVIKILLSNGVLVDYGAANYGLLSIDEVPDGAGEGDVIPVKWTGRRQEYKGRTQEILTIGDDPVKWGRREYYRAGIFSEVNGNKVQQHTFEEGDFINVARKSIRSNKTPSFSRVIAAELPYTAYDGRIPKRFVCRNCKVRFRITYFEKKILRQLEIGQIHRAMVMDLHEDGFLLDIHPGISGIVDRDDVLPKGVTPEELGYCDIDEIMRPGSVHLVKVMHKRVKPVVDLKLNKAAAHYATDGDVYSLSELAACPSCGESNYVHPDSRALHYVADEVLTDMFGTGQREYSTVFDSLVAGEFEEIMDESFEEVLAASRALEGESPDIPLAVKAFPLSSEAECLTEDDASKPPIRDYVRWRIGQSLKRLDGEEFMRIVNGVD